MKILFCTNKFDEISNGPAKFSNLLLDINNLFKNHELRILTEDIADTNKVAGRLYRVNVKYPKFLWPLSQFFRMYYYHKAAINIKKSDYDFDLLIYNNALVGLLSGIFFSNTIGMINDYSNAGIRLSDIEVSYPFFKSIVFRQAEFLSTLFQKKIIVNSQYLSNCLKSTYPRIDKKIHILYKSVEEPAIIKSSIEINKSQPIRILFVKRDYMIGGLFDLVESLKLLKYHFVLTIIGPDKDIENKLISEMNSTNNITYNCLGICPQSLVFDHLISTDIFCVPSRMEALGVANLEAIARGVPVVSTNVGGIPEVLDFGNAGWLAQVNNPTDLANNILQCIENDSLRKEKRIRGLEYSKKFSKIAMFNNFLKIITTQK